MYFLLALLNAYCPQMNGYAYSNGEWCCKTDKDEHGKPLAFQSNTCENSAAVQCRVKKCYSNPKGIDMSFAPTGQANPS